MKRTGRSPRKLPPPSTPTYVCPVHGGATLCPAPRSPFVCRKEPSRPPFVLSQAHPLKAPRVPLWSRSLLAALLSWARPAMLRVACGVDGRVRWCAGMTMVDWRGHGRSRGDGEGPSRLMGRCARARGQLVGRRGGWSSGGATSGGSRASPRLGVRLAHEASWASRLVEGRSVRR